MKLKIPTEHDEQTNLFKWIEETREMQTDTVKRLALKWTHAIPNGYHKSMGMRMKAKREGVTSGILDVCVPAPDLSGNKGVRHSSYHGLYIEMKRRNEKPSDTQVEFMDYLSLVNYRHHLCFDWTDAARQIVSHLGLILHAEIPLETDYERARRLYNETKRKTRRKTEKMSKVPRNTKKAGITI